MPDPSDLGSPPPDAMGAMGGAAAPPSPVRPPSPGPTAPATVSVQNQGNLLRARGIVGMAMTFLDQALGLASSKTAEGQAIMKALQALSKNFGPAPKDFGPQELKLAASRMNPLQGGGPAGAVGQRQNQLGLGAPRGPQGPRMPQAPMGGMA